MKNLNNRLVNRSAVDGNADALRPFNKAILQLRIKN